MIEIIQSGNHIKKEEKLAELKGLLAQHQVYQQMHNGSSRKRSKRAERLSEETVTSNFPNCMRHELIQPRSPTNVKSNKLRRHSHQKVYRLNY